MQYRVIRSFVYMGQRYMPGEVWLPLGAHTDRLIQDGRWVHPDEAAQEPATPPVVKPTRAADVTDEEEQQGEQEQPAKTKSKAKA